MQLWLERIKWRLTTMMQGRYGNDVLSIDLWKMALFFWIISLFVFRKIFSVLYLICMAIVLYRMYSRNIVKRRKELEFYLGFRKKPLAYINLKKRIWRDRKTHRYFRCACGTMLRVPKGKGKINIHCQNCDRHMIKRT
ncbi:MAG: hypothetical protein E7393_02170 [Ruminococcaceae bacterium]|nr:hypothetical protein [Oscillospiraceae bacterium]